MAAAQPVSLKLVGAGLRGEDELATLAEDAPLRALVDLVAQRLGVLPERVALLHGNPLHALGDDQSRSLREYGVRNRDLIRVEVQPAHSGESKQGAAAFSAADQGIPLPQQLLLRMNEMLFGKQADAGDVRRWQEQGFTFSAREETSFGLTQLHGGPCGILAVVQGEVLVDLLFARRPPGVVLRPQNMRSPLHVPQAEREAALVNSLARVLLRCQERAKLGVTLVSGRAPDALRMVIRHSEEEVRAQLVTERADLAAPGGVLLFVYSLLLTRSLERVAADVDEPDRPLVQRFGHCGQELVNLCLCGRALSNCFDGDRNLGADRGGQVLRGIPARGDVGFLSVMEAMRLSPVGNYLKRPRFPVWVIGSESHYSVLFAVDPQIGGPTASELKDEPLEAAFRALDPEDTKMIASEKLGELIRLAQLPEGVVEADLSGELGSDFGFITWEKFRATARKVLRDYELGQWACGVCTYLNKPGKARCEMCDAAAPPPPAMRRKNSEDLDEEQRFIVLFHYNGLDGHGGDVAQCTGLFVTACRARQLGDALPVERPTLREVVQTRWPEAVVEFDGGRPPKIT